MNVMATERSLNNKQELRANWIKSCLWSAFLIGSMMLLLIEPAFATGTGTTTGTGGAAAAQTRIAAVATGWQNIVMAVGVAILIIAWSVIGYAIAFNGKTMKDMQNPAVGTTIAGLAPVLVGWLFS
jgi:hypothetical protein